MRQNDNYNFDNDPEDDEEPSLEIPEELLRTMDQFGVPHEEIADVMECYLKIYEQMHGPVIKILSSLAVFTFMGFNSESSLEVNVNRLEGADVDVRVISSSKQVD